MKKIWQVSILLALVFMIFPFMDAASFAGSLEYVEGEVIVLLKNSTGKEMVKALSDGAVHALAAASAKKADAVVDTVYKTLSARSGYGFAVVKSDVLTTEELIKKLREDPDVVSVSPNFIYPSETLPAPAISPAPAPAPSISALAEPKILGKTPNDPLFPEMWNLKKINAPAAWAVSTGDPNVLVAIVDTGIDGTHEDLVPNIDAGLSKSFTIDNDSPLIDTKGHGTHVSGIIIGVGNNNLGIAGVTPDTRAIALKLQHSIAHFSMPSRIEAIEYILNLVDNGENIVAINFSNSIASTNTPEEMRLPQNFGYLEWLAFKTLSDTNKVVIVVCAGNDGIEVGKPHQDPDMADIPDMAGMYLYNYPADYLDIDNMIVVAAMDRTDSGSVWNEDSASPSGWGATNWSPTLVDIAAPGSEILSTWTDNQYMSGNGTSYAAPHVTGAVALLASVGKKFGFSPSAQDYKRIILESAGKKIPELTLNGRNLGPIAAHGTLDLQAAVTQMLKEYVPEYDFTPINIDWTDGKAPAPVAGEPFTARVEIDREYKNVTATLVSPNGTETSLAANVSGSHVETTFTPPTAGDYALNFTATDGYDVEWDTSLPVSVKAADNDGGGDVATADNGGGGGCSAFGTEFLVLVGIAACFQSLNSARGRSNNKLVIASEQKK
jgi:subtilisin family serine protease